jgi:hypothetical protein
MKKPRRQKRIKPSSHGLNRRFVVLTLVLMLIASGVILGQRIVKKKKDHSQDLAPASLTSSRPSKEYIYAGGKLVATEEPTAASNGDDAQFVSLSFNPASVEPYAFSCLGDLYTVTIVMRNSGNQTWAAGSRSLGSLYADQWVKREQNQWLPLTRVPLTSTVQQGQNATFTFTVARSTTHPQAGNGNYYFNFQWQMVQDGGVGWFGEKTPNRVYRGGCALPGTVPDNSSFVSQTVPSVMCPGQTYSVSITMNNSGSNLDICRQL